MKSFTARVKSWENKAGIATSPVERENIKKEGMKK
jgi:hypothetical protein